jgi:hypothetical protein
MYENLIFDLPFKGSREYLHSTDIFPALTDVAHKRFGPLAWVDSLTIRRPFRRIIQVSFEPVEVSSGSFRIRNGSQHIPGWLLETDRPVTRRIPYDTSPLSAAAVSGSGYARFLEGLPGFSVLDVLVSLMKLVSAQVDRRQWMICQLNLDAPLAEIFPVEVRIRSILAGKFLVSDILQAGTVSGSARGMLEDTKI